MAPASPKYDVVETPPLYDTRKSEGNLLDHDDPAPRRPSSKLAKLFFGMPGIIAGAVLGIAFGVLVQRSSPSAVVVSWAGVPGDLFIRALKCLIPPLVFCTMVVGMADMYAVGKAGKIGWRAFGLYTLTTLVATAEGLVAVIIFRPSFSSNAKAQASAVAEFALQCGTPGYFVSQINDTITCAFDATFNSTSKHAAASTFLVSDLNDVFSKAGTKYARLTLSESLQAQLQTMVPSNITQAFADGMLLSIIMFSIPFGIAIALLPHDMKRLAMFFGEVNHVFMSMITWVIKLTPIAIVSLLTKSIASQKDLSVLVSDVGVFVLCVFLTLLFHVGVFYPALLRLFVKANPYVWIKKMASAQIFALSCASSMATLPITMDCIEKTGEVSATIYRFILSLGATINMDGTAIYFPIAIIFMAEAEGLGHLIGGVEMFLIVLVSTIGAVGTAPVPSAGIVMTITIWQSVLSSQPLPSSFAYIIATDWILDRFKTCVNVTGDTIVTRIVAETVGQNMDMQERASVASATDAFAQQKSEIRDVLHSTTH